MRNLLKFNYLKILRNQAILHRQIKAIDVMGWIDQCSCWGLGALFIYAGTLKLLDPRAFATLIEAYGIIPEQLLVPLSIVLPALEVVAGMGLVLNIKGSLSAIAALLVLFVLIVTYGIWMGLDVDCGCFGPQDPEAEAFHGLWPTLYRDSALLVGIVIMYGWRRYHDIHPIEFTRFIKNRTRIRRKKDAHV
jgi:uncharacterized membrane protein YphA (DoxX/SURF4 family)